MLAADRGTGATPRARTGGFHSACKGSRRSRAAATRPAAMAAERVTFPAPLGGHAVVGLLSPPAVGGKAEDQQAAAIVCHGYCDCKDARLMADLATGLTAAGLWTLRFDFSGNGESCPDGVQLRFGNYEDEAEEIEAARAFLVGRNHRVVGVVGHSKGANDVLLHAAAHASIPRAVALAPRCWLDGGIVERFGADVFDRLKVAPVPVTVNHSDGRRALTWQLTDEDVKRRVALDMEGAAARINAARVAVAVVHGSADTTISLADGERLAEVTPRAVFTVVDGADHNFRDAGHRRQAVDATVAFIAAGM